MHRRVEEERENEAQDLRSRAIANEELERGKTVSSVGLERVSTASEQRAASLQLSHLDGNVCETLGASDQMRESLSASTRRCCAAQPVAACVLSNARPSVSVSGWRARLLKTSADLT